jgi:queuine tRNA-ribosyltransferase
MSPVPPIRFEIQRTCGRARVGRVMTPHGAFETPAFMPVATKGAVKGIDAERLRRLGAQIVLANTYHLAQRPGDETVEALGGLHAFMRWDGPILTDSGGFQIFSLSRLLSVSEAGVEFRSSLDGEAFRLTPERAIEIQRRLGSDLWMPLDQPIAWPCTSAEARAAMERTHRWLERTNPKDRGRIFGIVQGGFDRTLRDASVDFIASFDFPGMAIGGLSMGEPNELMIELADHTAGRIPAGRVRYLMGVGTPADLVRCVAMGIDLFDCVLPTRMGRTGAAFSSTGLVKLRNRRYARDAAPLDPACACAVCGEYSRAYLRHCFNTHEMLGPVLVSFHNLFYYTDLMRRIRAAITDGTLDEMLKDGGQRWGSLRTTSAS